MHRSRVVPTAADIDAARTRLAPRLRPTPFLPSPWLSDLTGSDVWLKLETVQPTGSFKIRGALNAVARLRETRPDATTVMTASAGNHGLALATAAAWAGLGARVHLPATAPAAKRAGLERLGAEVVPAPSYDAAEDAARAEAADPAVVFISPYDDEDVIAGAGTAAAEMFDDRPDLDTLVVPLGGGGLLAGAALVARARAPRARVIGAEAAASPVFTAALAAGRPVTVEVRPTLADGLAGNMDPDSRTFGIVRDLVDRVVTVEEDVLARAMRELVLSDRLVVEGAGAAAVGAVLAGGLSLAGRRIGIILSGRNVDRGVLGRVLTGAPAG